MKRKFIPMTTDESITTTLDMMAADTQNASVRFDQVKSDIQDLCNELALMNEESELRRKSLQNMQAKIQRELDAIDELQRNSSNIQATIGTIFAK